MPRPIQKLRLVSALFGRDCGSRAGRRATTFEWRFDGGGGEPDRAAAFTTELIALAPDVIVAHGTPALGALHGATRTLPVVFVSVIDPVGAGYVESLARPGGNITGFSTFEPEIGGKWLELLKEIAPGLSRVAGILDPSFRGFAGGMGRDREHCAEIWT